MRKVFPDASDDDIVYGGARGGAGKYTSVTSFVLGRPWGVQRMAAMIFDDRIVAVSDLAPHTPHAERARAFDARRQRKARQLVRALQT